MRKQLLLLFITLTFTSVKSQQLYFEGGKTQSAFDYKNSSGESLNNLQSTSNTYLGLGYRSPLVKERLFINLGGSFTEYGAIGSDAALDNYYEWNLNYLGANLSFDYEFFKPGNFTFYLKAGASAEFLVQGTQTLNNQVYSLFHQDDFKSGIYVLKGGIGMQYKVSENLSVFSLYSRGMSKSFSVVQGDLKIKTHNFGFGVLLNVSKNRENTMDYKIKLEELNNQLESNSQKIMELEEKAKIIASLEAENKAKALQISNNEDELKRIKMAVYNSLFTYQGNDLNIEDRDGKVHVTLQNDVIFNSGSTKLSTEGKKAVQDLANVLASNPELEVTIEGHTDNMPFKNSNIKNRELSLKRAATIVEVLSKNESINPKNLMAAGMGEFNPIADNSTEEGRAKNRRIEIVLTPKFKNLIEIVKN